MAKVRRSGDLDRILEQLNDGYGRALTLGAMILKQEMQRLAPIDTGRMTRSVTVTDPVRTDKGLQVLVGPTVDYAKYTELEPWIIGKRPGPRSQIKGASIPWMRPAADNVRKEVAEVVSNGIRQLAKAIT